MLSRLQELKREEETLLKIKAALHDQLNRLKVEELALQSMIRSREEVSSAEETEEPEKPEVEVDNEVVINQTELQLSTLGLSQHQEEEMEEEESD
ncbi:snRNA-activating protein complex subunit 5 [Ambystoma mexicanum]|uniref:snRNA-activating protein complex subunit 5 n=1 Tax=Ambystoma mexicanum TaxID=8296 RepID=UPI0037E8962B